MKAMRGEGPGQAGFTMIENAFSIAVIAAVALPLVGMLAISADGNRTSDFRRESSLLVRQVVGDLRVGEGRKGVWEEIPKRLSEGSEMLVYLAYDEKLQLVREVTQAQFEKGLVGEEEAGVRYVVEVKLWRQEELSNAQELVVGGGSGGAVPYGLASIRVTGPAEAALRSRQVEGYSTRVLLTNQVRSANQ